MLLSGIYYWHFVAVVNEYLLIGNGVAIGFAYGWWLLLRWSINLGKGGRGACLKRSVAALAVFLYHLLYEYTKDTQQVNPRPDSGRPGPSARIAYIG
jgi:hypothetical protein